MKSGIFAGFAAIAALAACASAEAAVSPVYGKWRVTRVVVAPWAGEAGALGDISYLGKTVTFHEKRVKGPGPIGCAKAVYETTDNPPDGLFQGSLPEPAAEAMKSLGLSGSAVAGISLSCDSGVFEYHYADSDTLLLGLDNRILTLDRTAGAQASTRSPEGVVQRFLEAHFAGDMAFTPQSVGAKSAFLSKALAEKIRMWFAAPQSADEAPEINGDPFTDSQEYPVRFAVGADDRKAAGVEIPVEFADAYGARTVAYVMTREGGRWLVGDIRYGDGAMLSEMLVE